MRPAWQRDNHQRQHARAGNRPLVSRPIDRLGNSGDLGQDGLGGGGPAEWGGGAVIARDEGVDALHELADGAEGAAPDGPLAAATRPPSCATRGRPGLRRTTA